VAEGDFQGGRDDDGAGDVREQSRGRVRPDHVAKAKGELAGSKELAGGSCGPLTNKVKANCPCKEHGNRKSTRFIPPK